MVPTRLLFVSGWGHVTPHAQSLCLSQWGQLLSIPCAKCIHNVLDPTTQTLGWKGDSFSSQTASATYDSPPQSVSHMSQQIPHTYLSCEALRSIKRQEYCVPIGYGILNTLPHLSWPLLFQAWNWLLHLMYLWTLLLAQHCDYMMQENTVLRHELVYN